MTDDARDQFEKLVGEFRPKLHRYCARMTGSAVDGEDIVQDALMKALAALPSVGVIDNPEGWLFRIAHNTALDFLRLNGLVHRIESRNAFMACGRNHGTDALVAFLICERCGAVGEAPAAAVAQPLAAAARSAGFTPTLSVIEITGTCSHCRKG